MQLAEDDRKILPRVVKDDEAESLTLQMYNYKTKEAVIEKLVDLSTAKFSDFSKIKFALQPCTSVYSMPNSETRSGKEFCQHF